MLTPKQKELLMFIHARVDETGVPPSFDEMKEALELKSKSGIHRLITALEERGFIRRLPHKARALEIVKLPDFVMRQEAASRGAEGSAAGAGIVKPGKGGPSGAAQSERGVRAAGSQPAQPVQRGFNPSIVEGSRSRGFSEPQRGYDDTNDRALAVPVMGRIAAGVPISAIETHEYDIEVPPDMISGGDHFALVVRGESMIDAGILDDDVVIIRRTNTANTGDIVVALVDREEATLKRLRRRGDSIALEAANPAFETRIFGPDRVEVQGRLVGLIRRYR